MYRLSDIELQNEQDQFSMMYARVARSVLDLCGRRVGEGIVRAAMRSAGRADGEATLARARSLGVPTDLRALYGSASSSICDPRTRANTIADDRDRQVWEVFTCPMADLWNRLGEGKIGSFFCEEYEYGRLLAYTEDKGQLCLSTTLTIPVDCSCCRFSVFFREANTTVERAREAFHAQERDASREVSFDDAIARKTIAVLGAIYAKAVERCGSEGACAVAEGLKKWSEDASSSLASQAVRTLHKVDAEFVAKNFPLPLDSSDDARWSELGASGVRPLVQSLVLDSIRRSL